MKDERPSTTGGNNEGKEEFLSDSQKIVRRHLENEDDVISEEDIKNIRIGMTPPDALSTGAQEEILEEAEEEAEEEGEDENKDGDRATPWDVVE